MNRRIKSLILLAVQVFVLNLFLSNTASAAKILLMPISLMGQKSSPVILMTNLGKELAKQGHDVHLVLRDTGGVRSRIEPVNGINFLTYKTNDTFDMSEEQSKSFKEGLSLMKIFPRMRDIIRNDVRSMFGDKEFYNKIKDMDFDLVVSDGIFFISWTLLLPYQLGIPYVILTPKYDTWHTGIPALPSFTPSQVSTNTEDMTFLQRLRNYWMYVMELGFTTALGICTDTSLSAEVAPDMALTTGSELMSNARLWLVIEEVLLEYPRPYLPHVIPIGGLTASPAGRLPTQLEDFVSSAPDGVIVVSLGSIIKSELCPQQWIDNLVTAFTDDRLSKMRIVWKYKGNFTTELTKNVKILDWLPQNDILGHPKTKLFIAHCGNNGQQEAVYHGVPSLCLPFGTDMYYNSNRMQYKGFGLFLDMYTTTAKEILGAINEILTNPKYAKNIKKASKIIQSRKMTPQELGVSWIEYYLQFGTDHLHSIAIKMPWWKYFMIDIFIFHMTLVVGISMLLKCCISFSYRKCCKSAAKVKTS